VDSAAEPEVGRPPGRGDVEFAAAGLRGVGACRFAEQVDRGSGLDVETVEGEVGQGFPGDPGRGGPDPHDLLDRGGPELGTLAEQPPLAGVLQEDLHGQAELVPGGVEAAEDQQHECIAQLGPGRTAAPPGRSWFARTSPPPAPAGPRPR
jgi:hypothetical protein